MQSLSEPGVCHGNLPPGQNTDSEKHCQRLRVSTSCLKGFCSNLELLCFDSNPVFLFSSHCVECGQKELTEDTRLFFTPQEDSLEGEERKCISSFLHLTNNERNHQEAFLEEKSAFAWISSFSYLMTLSKAHTSSCNFFQPNSFPI